MCPPIFEILIEKFEVENESKLQPELNKIFQIFLEIFFLHIFLLLCKPANNTKVDLKNFINFKTGVSWFQFQISFPNVDVSVQSFEVRRPLVNRFDCKSNSHNSVQE